MKKIIGVFVCVLAVGACATQPDKIASAYVSPLQYKDYDCDQISMELARVNSRVNALHTSLKKTADDDAGQMAVGLILLWPTLFFLEGSDGPEAQEYARLKGEKDALDVAAVQKKCMINSVQQTTEGVNGG